MKRLLTLVAFVLLFALPVHGQQGNTLTIVYPGVPSGTCAFPMFGINGATGDLYDCLAGAWNKISGGAGGSSLFSALQTSTNTTATMTVGTGATLTFSGTGVVNSTEIQGVTISGTPGIGQVPIASSSSAAAWGDPVVSGPDAPGAAPTRSPVQMSGVNGSGNVTRLLTDASGNLGVNVNTMPTVAVTGTFWQTTQPVSIAANVGVTQQTSPWVESCTAANCTVQLADGSANLGAMVNYGSTPTAVKALSANVFVTNTPAVTLTSTTITGTVAVTQSTSPWVVSCTAANCAMNLSQVGGASFALGQQLAASSLPVVLTAAQITTLTPLATVAVTQSTSPWVSSCTAANCAINLTQVAGATLGTPQTLGTAPSGIVIGTSSDVYHAGTRARSNQTTTAAGVLDVNIVGSLGVTNSATNGTFARLTDNTTAVGVIVGTTALKTDMSSVAGTATVTAASGVQKVGIVGNTGATFDAATNGAVPTNQIWQVPTPTTAVGGAISSSVKATVTASVNVKASAGNLYGVFAINGAASTCWVQFVNSAGAGTLGTATIVSFPLPASTTQPIWVTLPYPINFSTGIAVGISTTNSGASACGTAGNLTVVFQ